MSGRIPELAHRCRVTCRGLAADPAVSCRVSRVRSAIPTPAALRYAPGEGKVSHATALGVACGTGGSRHLLGSCSRRARRQREGATQLGVCGRPRDQAHNAIVDQDVTDRERDAASMAQGKTRFARGLRFFAAATDEAAAQGVSLRWQLRLVPGADHSAVPMVRAALDELDK